MWERGIVMPYESERGRPEAAHHLILEDRQRLSVSGVEEVESFDETAIVMHTSQGTLVIRRRGGGGRGWCTICCASCGCACPSPLSADCWTCCSGWW